MIKFSEDALNYIRGKDSPVFIDVPSVKSACCCAVGEPPALALQFAGLRASEIIAGSLTALWLAWLFSWLLERQPVWPFWWGRLRLRWVRR